MRGRILSATVVCNRSLPNMGSDLSCNRKGPLKKLEDAWPESIIREEFSAM